MSFKPPAGWVRAFRMGGSKERQKGHSDLVGRRKGVPIRRPSSEKVDVKGEEWVYSERKRKKKKIDTHSAKETNHERRSATPMGKVKMTKERNSRCRSVIATTEGAQKKWNWGEKVKRGKKKHDGLGPSSWNAPAVSEKKRGRRRKTRKEKKDRGTEKDEIG